MKTALLLFVITVLFFWKISLTRQYTWMDHPDMVNQVLPWYQFQADEWHAGRFPLWDPFVWGGQSLIGQVQPGVAYPLNWLLFLSPLKNGRIPQIVLHWYFVLIHYMGALFCYLLCRDLGRSRAASLLGAAAFGFAGYVGTTDWPQMLNGAIWMPLVFLFVLRAMRGYRPLASGALAGAASGAAWLAGHHQIPIFMTLAAGVCWAWMIYRTRVWKPAAAFGAMTFLVGALQMLPAYEYGRLSLRWVSAQNPVSWGQYVPYIVHGTYSLFPVSLLGIIFPGFERNTDPFIGVVIFSMALAAVWAMWRDRTVRLFVAMAVCALFFALGQHSIFHGVLYVIVPLVEKARNPAMAIAVFHFAAAVLAAHGLDALRERGARESVWLGRLVIGLMAVAALAFATVLVASVVRPQTGYEYEWIAMTAFASVVAGTLLWAWKRGHARDNAAVTMLFLLALFEVAHVTGYKYRHREQPGGTLHKLAEDGDIVQFLRARPEAVRIQVDQDAIPYNFGDWNRIEQFRAYAGLTENIAKIESFHWARKLLGVHYYIGYKPRDEWQEEVFAGASGLRVYRSRDVMPPAWAMDSCEGNAVRMTNREPSHVGVDADLRCAGTVVIHDSYYPGWVALVDGNEAEVIPAYGFLRGVRVPAGHHRIEFRYRPKSVLWGAVLSGIGVLIAIGTAVWPALARAGLKSRPQAA